MNMKHGDRVKLQILETACRLIGAIGLEPVTFRRIGIECGMSPNAILHHFKSRDALIRAVYYHATRQDDAKCLGQLIAARHQAVAAIPSNLRAVYLAALV